MKTSRPADEVALRRAVRTGRVPDDHRLHGMLPAHLAWLRRGTWYALAAGLPLFAGLVLIALLGTDDIRWAITYLLGAAL
ncbi:MAG TPA: hypothetical protein VHN18_07040, partial [Micromonosporaceae bacterium]|nr:hypothetical protein [Micromonosporaceae bacterium]